MSNLWKENPFACVMVLAAVTLGAFHLIIGDRPAGYDILQLGLLLLILIKQK